LKKVKLFLKIAFILFAFYIIFSKIPIERFKEINLKYPILLIFAFIFYNLSQIISAKRIENYLKPINITPTFKYQLVLYYIGMFYNTLLPGGIGGDAYKTYKFQKKFNTGYKKIIKALLIDRISGLFAIFLIISVLAFFTDFKYSIFLTFLIITPFFLYFIHKFFFIEFKSASLKSFIYSIIIQLLQGFTFILILLSFGVTKKLIDLVILFFISSIISVVPISVGGVGLRELTFLYASEFIHTNPASVILAAFVFFLINLISSIIGGILLLRSKNV